MDDIDLMRGALAAAGARRLADAMLLPLRREVGAFRFSTVRLDVRENSMRINQTLAALFRVTRRRRRAARCRIRRNGSDWLLAELGTPRERASAATTGLPRGGRGNARDLPHHRPHARGDRPRSLRRA